MYRAFPTTLRGSTIKWYAYLKPLSISSFAQLEKEFKLYFLRNVRPRPATMMLLGLRQGKEEILANFVNQFTNEIQK